MASTMICTDKPVSRMVTTQVIFSDDSGAYDEKESWSFGLCTSPTISQRRIGGGVVFFHVINKINKGKFAVAVHPLFPD